MSPDKIRSALATDKTNLQNLHAAVRNASNQLTLDLVSGKDKSTITADQTALQIAQNNLLGEKVKLVQSLLANLSASQRTQAALFVTQRQALRQQQSQQRQALFQKFGGSAAGSTEQ